MFDLFSDYSLMEILRVNSLFMMGAMIVFAMIAMGAVSEPTRGSSKRFPGRG